MTPDRTVDGDRPGDVPAVPGPPAHTARSLVDGAGVPPSGADGRPDVRYVALGAVARTERGVAAAARATVGVTRAVGGTVVGLALPLVPGIVRTAVADLGRDLDEQGRVVVAAGTAQFGRLSDELAEALGRNARVLRLVEQVVERIQWQVVDTVLPVVLERLAAEPEQVRAIVQGQSRGVVDELTTNVRTRAVTADKAVDRVVASLLRRPPLRGGAPGSARSPDG